jgi:hypothetical protein
MAIDDGSPSGPITPFQCRDQAGLVVFGHARGSCAGSFAPYVYLRDGGKSFAADGQYAEMGKKCAGLA